MRSVKAVKKLKETSSCIAFPRLENIEKWRLLVFSDAALANMDDGVSSTAGYVIFLTEGKKSCALAWHSGKIKRVVRSTIAAEALSCKMP